jgi:hypothetical protein
VVTLSLVYQYSPIRWRPERRLLPAAAARDMSSLALNGIDGAAEVASSPELAIRGSVGSGCQERGSSRRRLDRRTGR